MTDSTVPRRSFLTHLAVGSAALTAACSGGPAASSAAMASADEMDQWFGAMNNTNKVIYDCAAPTAGPNGVMFARNFIKFSEEQLDTTDADNSVVVCFRHFATPFAYNDAMWAKYPGIAVTLSINDPKTMKPATRNFLLHDAILGEAGADLPSVTAHGVQFAVCGAATTFIAKLLAGTTGDAAAIDADLSANLIPGSKMAPAGVVAVQRAQKAGFAYTFAG
ncbi:MAG: hypothetical protein O2973_11340 [Gemmatimonadetes bacterium]|nr:hypothetical protein [Gemmatimonadota bacterium]